jgi:hypothetical protein
LMPTAMLIGMELAVLDEAVPLYMRGLAWARLVNHWASLRFSDTQWIAPSSLLLTPFGLTGRLSRSKTSGAGKKVLSQTFSVSTDSWISRSTWLSVGVEI